MHSPRYCSIKFIEPKHYGLAKQRHDPIHFSEIGDRRRKWILRPRRRRREYVTHSQFLKPGGHSQTLEWTVQSQSTFAGTYTSKQVFRDATWKVLATVLDPETPLKPKVRNVVGGSGQPYAVVEMTSDSRTLKGTEYKQTYAWVTRWKSLEDNPKGIIVEVRAYLDTALVDKVVAEKAH